MVRVLKLATPHQVKRVKRSKQLLLCEAPKHFTYVSIIPQLTVVFLPSTGRRSAPVGAPSQGQDSDMTGLFEVFFFSYICLQRFLPNILSLFIYSFLFFSLLQFMCRNKMQFLSASSLQFFLWISGWTQPSSPSPQVIS